MAKKATATATAPADVKTEHGIKSHADHTAAMAAAETDARERRARRVSSGLHNVYQVDYYVRPKVEKAKKGQATVTTFAPPTAAHTGSIRLAAIADEDVPAALTAHVEVGDGETLEVASVRTLLVDVHHAAGKIPKPSNRASSKAKR